MIDIAEELTIALQVARDALWAATVPVRWNDPRTPVDVQKAAHDLRDGMDKATAADAIVPRYTLIFPGHVVAADEIIAPQPCD